MRHLTDREKWLLIFAGSAVTLLASWHFAVYPALAARAASRVQIAEVESVAGVLDQLSAQNLLSPVETLPPLRIRVTETAGRLGVEIQRLDPQGSALSVSLDDVAFAKLVGWLGALTGSNSVRILSAEISRRPEPGTVSARFVLEDAQ